MFSRVCGRSKLHAKCPKIDSKMEPKSFKKYGQKSIKKCLRNLSKKTPKIDPKIDPKSLQKSTQKLIEKWSQNRPQIGAKNGPKIDAKIKLGRPGAKMEPKSISGFILGAKMDPKWTKNWPKLTKNGPKIDSKIDFWPLAFEIDLLESIDQTLIWNHTFARQQQQESLHLASGLWPLADRASAGCAKRK